MATDNSTFKRKKRPSGSSYQLSLEEHIAKLDENPHPQYARKTDIETIKAGITVVHQIEDNRNTIPSSHVVFVVNDRLSSFETALSLCVTKDVADATYATIDHNHNETYSAIEHDHAGVYALVTHDHDNVYVKQENLNLEDYILRSDLSGVGVYPNTVTAQSTTEFVYVEAAGVFEANVNYYWATEDNNYELYPQYVVTEDSAFITGKVYYVYNEDSGTYVQTSDVVKDADITYYESQYLVGEAIPSTPQLFIAQDKSVFDFNDHLTQGQYYIQTSTGVTYKNNPDGITEGLLYINRCETIVYDSKVEGIAGRTNIVQQLISTLGTYKRDVVVVSKNVLVEETLYKETTDTEFQSGTIYYVYDEESDSYTQTTDATMQTGTTYYTASLSTSLQRTDETTYGDWIFLNDSNPIGSLLFMTGNEIPAGYIEANGASYSKTTYPTLWNFVKSSMVESETKDSCFVLDIMKFHSLGCYSYLGPIYTGAFPADGSAYIGGLIALYDGRLISISDAGSYSGKKDIFHNSGNEKKRANYLLSGDAFVPVAAGTTLDKNATYFRQVEFDTNGLNGLNENIKLYNQVWPTNNTNTVLPDNAPSGDENGYGMYYTCANAADLHPVMVSKANFESNANKFSVPTLTDKYIRMWANNSDKRNGSYLEAGLPNITGRSFVDRGGDAGYNGVIQLISGAFYTENTLQHQAATGANHSGGSYPLYLDASRSSKIYGKSDTVTPESVNIHVLIKAYQGSIMPPDANIASIDKIVSDKVAAIGEATTSTKGLVRLATTADVNNKTAGAVAVTPTTLRDQNYIKYVVFNGSTLTPTNHVVNLGTAASFIGNRIHRLDEVALNCTAVNSAGYYEWTITDTDVANADTSIMEARVMLQANSASNALGYPADSVVNNPLCVYKNQDDSEYLCSPQMVVYKTSIEGVSVVKVRLYWPVLWYMRAFNSTTSNTYPLYNPGTADPSVSSVSNQLQYWNVLVNLKY